MEKINGDYKQRTWLSRSANLALSSFFKEVNFFFKTKKTSDVFHYDLFFNVC